MAIFNKLAVAILLVSCTRPSPAKSLRGVPKPHGNLGSELPPLGLDRFRRDLKKVASVQSYAPSASPTHDYSFAPSNAVESDSSKDEPLLRLEFVRDQKPSDPKLGRCQGDCDTDDDCAGNLVCFQRDRMQFVPGCVGGEVENSLTDFCAPPPPSAAAHQASTGSASSRFDDAITNVTNISSESPSVPPSISPSSAPVSNAASLAPSQAMIGTFSLSPSDVPSNFASGVESSNPSIFPSYISSYLPSLSPLLHRPSSMPTQDVSPQPSVLPTLALSESPSGVPSSEVSSAAPSHYPTGSPSEEKDVSSYKTLPALSLSESPSGVPSSEVSSAAPSHYPTGSPPAVEVISSSNAYGGRSVIHLPRPTMQVGDLLVLFLSRTDDPLPLRLDGWSTVATCFKENNGQPWCITAEMCYKPDGDYCRAFRRGPNGRHNYRGLDLGTIVLTRAATQEDVDREEYYFDLRGRQPGWAILVVVRGADVSDPIRSHSGVTCDKERQSVFASTYGEADDLLLMHMGFDDTSTPERFQPPAGSHFIDYAVGPDEAGFVWAETLHSTGMTGDRMTLGRGASSCKDVNIAVVIRAGK